MIGREKEKKELEQLYNSGRAELVAVCGRRRVGKTFLINEMFSNKFTFKHTGLSPEEHKKENALRTQLGHFHDSLKEYGLKNSERPESWLEAFSLLRALLSEKDNGTRQVVFIDELPWLDTKRSGFITGFEAFWNGWGSARHNLMVIVCGSSTLWMQNKLINNHGGLYGRITYEIYLTPFNLGEIELFFKDRGIELSQYDIAQSYMILGGIPYYIGYFKRHLSLAQNIDELFFKPHAKLKDEYTRLFRSVFSNPEQIMLIVDALGKRRMGYTRSELAAKIKTSENGKLTDSLNALIAGDFIMKYVPFGMSRNKTHYKLIDPFCIFYLHFVKEQDILNEDFWEENVNSQPVVSWRGIAFENLCFNHIRQIKDALKIGNVASHQSAWVKRDEGKDGTQIDLLIDRKDNIVNMCEIKFYGGDYSVDKGYYRTLMNRKELLSHEVSKKTAIHNTLITTFGLMQNEYSGIFTDVITLDELFE
ncbi:MAG: AAA family ATPase [Lachnospiraceae bacterium]|nr:AAA family ATPase [Lachnospiraceae bacterium]